MVFADAGYWHNEQMERIVGARDPGPDPARRGQTQRRQAGMDRRYYEFMRGVLTTEHGKDSTDDDRQ